MKTFLRVPITHCVNQLHTWKRKNTTYFPRLYLHNLSDTDIDVSVMLMSSILRNVLLIAGAIYL